MSTDPRFAEPTPFARLVYAQAAGACGDAAILVSMAGSIFFSSPTSAARGKVLLFLLITMTPFVIIAPVLGPALDRMKGGRRLFLISSAAGRAAAVHRPGDVHQQTGARGPARVPARVRRARPPEGQRDRQERARARAGEGRRRARHRQLAPRAHQRGRCVRRRRARVRGLQALRRRLVAALRRGRVRRSRRSSPSRSRARGCANPSTSRSSSSSGRRCTRRASCSVRARSPCCERASGSWRSSPRSRSSTTSWRWVWPAPPRTSATSAVCSSRPRCVVRCVKR